MRKVLIIGAMLLFVSSVFAGVTGKISGRVIDKETGEPLPAVNVIIEGTTLGAATDANGEYFIINVPVGTYTVVASMVGYKPERVTNVKVSADMTTTVNFKLALTVLKTKAIEVKATRPIIQPHVTSSRRLIEDKEIQRTPAIRDFTDVVALQAGAVETRGGLASGLHIRGGRENETVYIVDGIYANDPVTGQSGLLLNKNAIQEMAIVTGGFNAEYGEAMSGIVNVITREGGKRHSGSIQYETDRPFIPIQTEDKWSVFYPEGWDSFYTPHKRRWGYGQDDVNFTLGGPIPLLKRATYFLSGDFLERQRGRLPNTDAHQRSGTAKLVFRPINTLKFTLSGNFSYLKYHRYDYNDHGFSQGIWLYETPLYRRDNTQLNLKVTHTLSPNTFYELNVGGFQTHFTARGQNGRYYHEWRAIGYNLPWVRNAYHNRWEEETDTSIIYHYWYDPAYCRWDLPDSILSLYHPLDSIIEAHPEWSDSIQAEIAWMMYYENLEYGRWDPDSGRWIWNRKTRIDTIISGGDTIIDTTLLVKETYRQMQDALNSRFYEVNSYQIKHISEVDTSMIVLGDDTLPHEVIVERLPGTDSVLVYHIFSIDTYLESYKAWMEAVQKWSEADREHRPEADSLRKVAKELEKKIEKSGNMYTIRYERDPEFRYFSYYFWPWWHDRNTVHYSARFDLTSQVTKHHQIKTGGSFRYHNLKLLDVYFANENPYWDQYLQHPIIGAAYIQDKFEYEDLTINGGLRFDYFNPNAEYYRSLDSLELGKTYTTPKYQLSPRFGISFAVSEKSLMYASYGWFFQIHKLEDLYQNLEADITNGLPLLGNPNLPPERTIAYQVGYRYAFTPDMAGEVTAYYKDAKNLLASRQLTTVYNRKLVSFTYYDILDFATIKGIDVTFTKRAARWLSLSLAYSYLDAKGSGSAGDEFYRRYMGTNVEPPHREYPLEFDITHSLKLNLNLYVPQDFTFKPLSDLNTNLQFNFSSGRPYTPSTEKGGLLEPNSKRLPPSSTVDLRIEKNFKFGGFTLTLYTDIRNLLDTKNVIRVYSNTGLPDDNGGRPRFEPLYYSDYEFYGYSSPEEYYEARVANWKRRVNNPGHFDSPRTIRVGITASF